MAGHRRVTVRDIAAETGMSIATVSRALNDHHAVTPATRALVHEAAERLRARIGVSGKPKGGTVFVRCPYVLTDYFGLIVSSIAETLTLHGRQLVLTAGEAAQRTPLLADLDGREPVTGVIVILPPEPGDDLVELQRRRMPFVVVDPRTTLPKDIVSVSAAHFAGARRLTAHLVELGHRRIGVIGGPTEWLASDARLAGHNAALADVGVLMEPQLLHSVEPTTERGHRAAAALLDLPDRPTALVCFNDKAAVGAMGAAAERGMRVPADLSITGFDDLDLAQATGLTTVRQPLQEMGRMAVSLLVRLLEQHQLDALHIELATELVVRASTAPPPLG
ncbi:LacI family DNA-binding transcriptional regulator [Dactylosporangium matsuzakiense]|nr:LacI family DNA-binding transcriptional regulator [Dactylosporangium matsuzakiense]UWZ47541.1 LacI family DNA-binding transcriptional regulator [Dactylosporangium matsuzakiense]